MLAQKNSILHRKPKELIVGPTASSIESDYAKEVARNEARAKRKADLREHLCKQFFATADEKKEVQEETRRNMQKDLENLEGNRRRHIEEQERAAEALRRQNAIETHIGNEQERVRREYLAHLREENQRLMNYRAQVRMQKAEQDLEDERNRPDFYRNYGRQPF